MDNEAKLPAERRFIGIDLGNNAARISKTIYDADVDEFHES